MRTKCQFLIGTVLPKTIEERIQRIREECQFLIGTVLHIGRLVSNPKFLSVSIPYRYGITVASIDQETAINSVSIPYRYGITTMFSLFPNTVFFFRLKYLQKKSVDLTFLLSQISLKNQAFL